MIMNLCTMGWNFLMIVVNAVKNIIEIMNANKKKVWEN